MFIPTIPLRFDATGKLQVYHTDELYPKRRLFKLAMIPPAIVLYCGVRAIQKRSLWRMAIWSLPSLWCARVGFNAFTFLSITIVSMHLKDDGETIVFETALYEGLRRKHVVKIREIRPHPEPETCVELLAQKMADSFFVDHLPILIQGQTYLLAKRGFINCEKAV